MPAQEVGVTQPLCLSPCFAWADGTDYAGFISPRLFPKKKSPPVFARTFANF